MLKFVQNSKENKLSFYHLLKTFVSEIEGDILPRSIKSFKKCGLRSSTIFLDKINAIERNENAKGAIQSSCYVRPGIGSSPTRIYFLKNKDLISRIANAYVWASIKAEIPTLVCK